MNWKGCGRKQEGYELGFCIQFCLFCLKSHAGRYITGMDCPELRVAMASKFCTVVSTLYGFSVWNYYVTHPVPVILRY